MLFCCVQPGADLGFSRYGGGGADFQKHFENFEKQSKKGIFRHFLENFDQKNRVFSARAPPQN